MSLDETVQNQMKETRSLTERIAMYVPIYRGYKERNLRRDEDRAIRTEVARSLEGTKLDLITIQRATLNNLDLMRDTERIKSKTDKYYIDVKKAVNGYSAFHSSVKIMQGELDEVIKWDAALIEDAVSLKEQTAAIVDSIDDGNTDLKKPLRDLERTVDKLLEDYNEREKVMRGFATEEGEING